MVGQRGLFHGREPGSRQAFIRWAFAFGTGTAVSACSVIANLSQFDGAQLAVADAGAGPDGSGEPDSAEITPPGPDGTITGDTDAGFDATMTGDDVVVAADTSVDQSVMTGDEPVEVNLDGGDAGPVYAENPGPGLDGGPCMPGWPDGGMNYVEQPDFEPGDPNTQADGGTQWFPVYGGVYTRVSTQAFCGSYSGLLTGRGAFYNALGTNVPPDAGTVTVAAWAMQDGDAGMQMAVGGVCFQAGGQVQYTNDTMTVVVAPNTWTQLTGAVTFQASWACQQSVVFVGQPSGSTAPYNDIYVDEAFFGQ